jgi:NAD-dependent SIR2 family protein deacetylase
MPTKTYTRTWCNTCKEFTLHHKPFEQEFQCKDCGDDSKTYKHSDIPEEKYREQIQRWKAYNSNKLGKVYSEFLNPSISWFNEPHKVEVIEDDLGYEKLRNERQAKEKEERKAKK